MSKPIYLDYAATTPVHPDVFQEMLPYFTEKFGNASTLYRLGNEAREAVETARQKVADAVGAQADEIYFTSGATESDNWAIIGAALAHEKKGKHIITTAIEHHAVLDTCKFLEKQGWRLTVLPVDHNGLVDPADVSSAITDETVLISVMHSNNEIGVIEPVSEIGAIARNKDILFHTDATQSVGKVPVNVDELNVDLLALSGHKIYGPKGVGALYVRKGTKISPYMHGGGQEKRKRAGTHNVPGIVGLGKAAEIAVHDMALESARLEKLRDKLIDGILKRIPHSRLNGHPTKRLPNNVNVCIGGVEGESMILLLDHNGICASSGSACTSGDLTASHVLLALGIPHELAHGSLRLTLGRDTNEADVDRVLEILPSIVNTLRAMSPVYEQT